MEVGEGWLASLGLLPGTFHVAAYFSRSSTVREGNLFGVGNGIAYCNISLFVP
jgi:hypothetical protein